MKNPKLNSSEMLFKPADSLAFVDEEPRVQAANTTNHQGNHQGSHQDAVEEDCAYDQLARSANNEDSFLVCKNSWHVKCMGY